MSIALRRTHFHGEVIYNSTRHFVHEDYKDRIILNLPEGQKSGFLQILNLREEDENMYFCRVQLKTQRFGLQLWQSILGTKLTIYLGESAAPAASCPPCWGFYRPCCLHPQAWPRPQSTGSPLLKTPLPTPTSSPGLCQLYSFSSISPNWADLLANPPYCPLQIQAPPPLPQPQDLLGPPVTLPSCSNLRLQPCLPTLTPCHPGQLLQDVGCLPSVLCPYLQPQPARSLMSDHTMGSVQHIAGTR